ncbi:hypothetical protein [Pseudonocardia endophytica]|uniref:Uncharacterized protein n=1 Tax=Pseudonocardia endophytica TaxID=401976 RepID=A0A4R1IBB3_PSEEN|nr:hypothetical protein [Pseudonocardia endophytica]TCK27712.1 hypothetical protein EV378_3590 [Pseudonocardia endophytica]
MYEHDEELSAAIGRRRAAIEAGAWPFPGRHESHDEIEDETPIFHALTVHGWRSRQRGSGNAVRAVHRPTVRRRTPRRGRDVVGDTLAGFHAAAVPEQNRARRDAERAADRAAVAHLLGGAGRHRLGTPA